MSLRLAVALFVCALTGGCGQRDGPPLLISDVVVPAPLPGTNITAGYLMIENNSGEPIRIDKVTSPQFGRVAMHETVVEDNVARMVALSPLIVEPRTSIRFESGAKHLMLSDGPPDIAEGLQISLEFHYDDGGLLIVATTVSPRDQLPE